MTVPSLKHALGLPATPGRRPAPAAGGAFKAVVEGEASKSIVGEACPSARIANTPFRYFRLARRSDGILEGVDSQLRSRMG